MASSDPTEQQTPPLKVPEPELESGVAQDEYIMGKWEVELRDWRQLLSGSRGFMACFCPFVTLAQISARLSPEGTFWRIATVSFVYLALIPGCAVVAIKGIVERERTFLVAIYVVVMAVYAHEVNFNTATLRGNVRERFQIPGKRNEDKLQALCCFPCVVAQMATQVKSTKDGSCSLSKPDELPSYVR